MNSHNKIDYIEIPSKNLDSTKAFFGEVFGWKFVDFGPNYCSFIDEGLDGGFFKSNLTVSPDSGSALIVFYSDNLQATQSRIEKSPRSSAISSTNDSGSLTI